MLPVDLRAIVEWVRSVRLRLVDRMRNTIARRVAVAVVMAMSATVALAGCSREWWEHNKFKAWSTNSEVAYSSGEGAGLALGSFKGTRREDDSSESGAEVAILPWADRVVLRAGTPVWVVVSDAHPLWVAAHPE